jgi:hypothetical protein
VTLSAVLEMISNKYFELETKLRDHLLNLINPYVRKSKEIAASQEMIMAENYKILTKLE